MCNVVNGRDNFQERVGAISDMLPRPFLPQWMSTAVGGQFILADTYGSQILLAIGRHRVTCIVERLSFACWRSAAF